MIELHANYVASISELKKNPSKLINEAGGQPVAILNHNAAAAYLVPAETYEKLLELVDDAGLEQLVCQRISDGSASVKVDLDEL